MSSPLAAAPPHAALAQVAAVRDRLQAARARHAAGYAEVNRIWREVLEVLGYALKLDAPDILRLRLHCGLFTGDTPWQFWHNSAQQDSEDYAQRYGYADLVRGVPPALWVSEPANPLIPRPMGVVWRGVALNPNVIRYQSIITNLHLTGAWERALSAGAGAGPAVVVEIGPGHGGLAEWVLGHAPRPVHYVAVDFPEILLFCAGCVLAGRPEMPVQIIEEPRDWARLPADRSALALVPSFADEALAALPRVALALNVASFQEMRQRDIERLLGWLMPKLDGVLCSDNINRHRLNTELPIPLTDIFARHGALYPTPEFYTRLLQANPWEWYYSTHFVGAAEAVARLSRRLRLIHGPHKLGPVREVEGEAFAR